MDSPNLFGSAIYTYSRQNALEDGIQLCLSDRFPEECRLYKYPVFCTASVWNLISGAAKNSGNAQAGIVWDLVWMSTKSSLRKHPTPDTCLFSVIIQGADRPPDFWEDGFPVYQLQAKCEAKDFDDAAPVITVSLLHES